jgi:hypothetical protein
LIDHPALSPFFVVWRRPESEVLISNSTRSRSPRRPEAIRRLVEIGLRTKK